MATKYTESRKYTPAASPAPASASTPKKMVVIQNKLPQLLPVSVFEDNGTTREIKLGPNSVSEAVEEAKLTPYTLRLVGLGHLRIRNA